LIAQTIKTKKNQQARRVKKAKEKKLISLGKRMMYPQQVTLQLEVKKQICASW